MKKITLLAFWLSLCFSAKAQTTFEASADYGKLHDITYDATVQNKLYAASFNNHIVVSVDNGATWNLLYSYPSSQGVISDLKMLPGNTALSFYTGFGIHILDLATNTLTTTVDIPQSNVAGAGASYITAYDIHDAAGQMILVNTGFSIGFSNFGKTFFTEDGGTTWKEVYYTVNHDNVFINNVAIGPNGNKDLFLARGLGDSGVNGGLWHSNNQGDDWTESLAGMAVSAISFKPGNTGEILVGTSISFGGNPENIFKSTDSGTTWAALPITWTDVTLNNITKIVYNPSNTSKVIALEENEILRSEDGGNTWTNTIYDVDTNLAYYYGLNASYNPFNENQVAITTDFYSQFSNDSSPALVQIKAPFFNIISTSIKKYGADKHLYYGGQGGRQHKNLTTGVIDAYEVESPNSFNPKQNFMYADPAIAGRVFTYAGMGFFGGFLNVSTDYGATTSNLLQSYSDDIQELVVDPSNSNVIYVSMRSGDNSTVSKIDFTDLTNVVVTDIATPDPDETGGVVTGIIINTTNSNEIYIAKRTKVYKSLDAGLTWEEKSIGLEWLNPAADLIWNFVKNPLNENQFSIATSAGVYTTTDAAENWTTALDGVNVNMLKYSPLNDGVIIGANFRDTLGASLTYSLDNGTTWNNITSAQLDYIATNRIDFDFDGNTIAAYIATPDLGVMKYVITDLPLSVQNPGVNDSSMTMYPNPATTQVALTSTKGLEIQAVTVFSLLGQKVLESNAATLNVSGLSKGTYVVKATTTTGKVLVQKLIKN